MNDPANVDPAETYGVPVEVEDEESGEQTVQIPLEPTDVLAAVWIAKLDGAAL